MGYMLGTCLYRQENCLRLKPFSRVNHDILPKWKDSSLYFPRPQSTTHRPCDQLTCMKIEQK